LELEHVTAGMIFRGLAVENGMTLEQFGRHAEEHPEVDWELDRRMVRRMRQGGVLVEGRLSAWMAQREGVEAAKVWLKAPEDIRASRVAQREGLTKEQALRANQVREKSESSRYMDIYGIDLADLSVYDAVIDSHDNDAESVARLIVDAARKRFP
ncbi:MAG: (d)CMP kinase, partial [bacterium]